MPKMIFNIPTPFPYVSDHAVPWKYDSHIEYITGTAADTKESLNITNAQRMTQSGRVYGSRNLEGTQNKAAPQKSDVMIIKQKKSGEEEEFLKIMKQSEYDIVDQLKKMPNLYPIVNTQLRGPPKSPTKGSK